MQNKGTYLVAILAAAFAADLARAEEKIAGFPRRITVRGTSFEVATPAELKAKGLDYEYPPPERNAAIELIDAMNELSKAMKANFPDKAYNHVLKHAWVEGEGLEQWLDEQGRIHDLVQLACDKPECVFPVHNAENVPAILLPHYAGLRSLARFLMVRSKLAAHEGDYAQAAEDLFMVLRIAEQTRHETFLIGGLVNIAIRAVALNALNDLVLRHDLSANLLDEIQQRIGKSQGALPKFADGMRGERWMAHDVVRQLVKSPQATLNMLGSGKTPTQHLDADGQRVRTALLKLVLPDQTMAAHFDGFYDAIEAASRRPPTEAAKFAKQNVDETLMQKVPRWNVLAWMLMPALSRAMQQYVRCDAQTRLARAVALIKRFHCTNRAWPERLEQIQELSKPDMADPFTGRPLRFVTNPKGWVLYSIGPDLSDDSGDAKKDVAVRFPAPAQKPFAGK